MLLNKYDLLMPHSGSGSFCCSSVTEIILEGCYGGLPAEGRLQRADWHSGQEKDVHRILPPSPLYSPHHWVGGESQTHTHIWKLLISSPALQRRGKKQETGTSYLTLMMVRISWDHAMWKHLHRASAVKDILVTVINVADH